jgi:N6-adenosine-specific RNA methylase IME4
VAKEPDGDCLLAVRGKPIRRADNWSTVLNAKRRAHSQKPEEFYRMVEELCPGPKVELFWRDARPGWAVHGDEVNPASRPKASAKRSETVAL